MRRMLDGTIFDTLHEPLGECKISENKITRQINLILLERPCECLSYEQQQQTLNEPPPPNWWINFIKTKLMLKKYIWILHTPYSHKFSTLPWHSSDLYLSQTTVIPIHSRHTPMVSLSPTLPWLPSHLHTHRQQPFPYIAGILPWLPSHSHSHGYPLTYTLTFSHQANKAKHYINITECTSKIHIWHN